MEPLTTANGIRRKVLVHERGVAIFDDAAGAPLDRPAPFWRPLYVFAVKRVIGISWYQVGLTPRRSSLIGWVSSEFAVEWNNRVGDFQPPIAEGGRSAPLLVYESAEAWRQILETGETEFEPIARAVPTGQTFPMPWPVAESERFVVNGKSYEVSRLLFLGEFAEQGPGRAERYSPAELTAFAADIKRLDVVFVCDNTSSTKPFLSAIVRAISDITNSLAVLDEIDLATGMVFYRDYCEQILFPSAEGPSVTRTIPLTVDTPGFLAEIAALREADAGSGDLPEAAYDGLHQALTGSPWRGDLSERVVIWIGDNSAHPATHEKNPRALSGPLLASLANAPETHATVMSICIKGAGSLLEQALHRRQCRYLSKETGGAMFSLRDSAAPLVARIQEILRTTRVRVETRDQIFQAAVTGKIAEGIASEELDPEEVTQCFEFLREFGNVDFARLGPGRPALGTGWVLTEAEGSPTLERKVYIARSELHFLIQELFGLTDNLNVEFVQKAVGLAGAARAGDYFKSQRPETMDVFLRARGIHCRSRSLLCKSRVEIEHMSEEERRILIEIINRQYIPGLLNARNNNDIFRTNISGLQFGWILESLLP